MPTSPTPLWTYPITLLYLVCAYVGRENSQHERLPSYAADDLIREGCADDKESSSASSPKRASSSMCDACVRILPYVLASGLPNSPDRPDHGTKKSTLRRILVASIAPRGLTCLGEPHGATAVTLYSRRRGGGQGKPEGLVQKSVCSVWDPPQRRATEAVLFSWPERPVSLVSQRSENTCGIAIVEKIPSTYPTRRTGLPTSHAS